jgi:predicted ATPase
MVLLSGEAGIGRSRITEALVDTAGGEPHFLRAA